MNLIAHGYGLRSASYSSLMLIDLFFKGNFMSESYPLHLINKKPNFYGFSGLDRAAHTRLDDEWFEKILQQDNAKAILSWRSQSMVNISIPDKPSASILELKSLDEIIQKADNVVFLGEKKGTPYVGVDLSSSDKGQFYNMIPEAGVFLDLREFGPLLERFEGSLLAYNRALLFWHTKNKYCGVCGGKTHVTKAGHQINCNDPKCGQLVFPRTDPAVIMLVHDGKRALLGRQKIWKPGMYSTLAGFLEPGETLEEAVAREVWEEANIDVSDVRYHSSQPWPFPGSIMLGFYAEAKSTFIRRNDEEVEDVQWFEANDLRNFPAHGKSLPRPDSIARRLIEDWLETMD